MSAPTARVLWSRADRPANAGVFEWLTTESFTKGVRALPTIAALPDSDFTVKLLARDLPSNQDIFYRVKFPGPLRHPRNRGRASH